MAFLDKLRSTNVFRPRPATDRPFGMPNIDSGNYNTLFREIFPVAKELRRQEQPDIISRGSLAPTRQPLMQRGVGGSTKKEKNVVYGGDTGFSPMQRRFREDELRKEENERQDARLAQNFMRQDELMRQKRMDESINFDKELGARKEMANFDLNRAVKLREVDKMAQAERDRFLANQRREDIITRERAQGEEARKTLATKPTTERPLDEGREFNNRVQQLMLDPRFAPHIMKDEATGNIKFSDDTTPEQAAALRQMLGISDKKAAETKPTGSGIRRQRNSKGEERISKDGGKTWEMVKK